MNDISIGMIGLGKLGLECAEVFSTHYPVYGYDIYPRKSDSIEICSSIEELIDNSNWIFIAVPTPHDELYGGDIPSSHLAPKDFNYDLVIQTLRKINQYANHTKNIVLISTVLPGTIRRLFMLELCHHELIYNPYLIAMGSVKWDMVNPEMLIVGSKYTNNTKVQELLKIYKPMMKNNPRAECGTWEEAESIKIFYNTYISAKLGIVNMIQDFAMRIGHINVDVVTDALANSDIRLQSPKYMTAGMGDSGACHPRDNIALRWLAEEYDLGYDIFSTIMQAREIQAKNLALFLIAQSNNYRLPIIIHGKAYKPDVPYIDGSYSTLIGHYIEENGLEVTYADPLTNDKLKPSKAVVLLAHNRNITYGYTKQELPDTFYFDILPGSVIVDPWRNIDRNNSKYKVIHYGDTRNLCRNGQP